MNKNVSYVDKDGKINIDKWRAYWEKKEKESLYIDPDKLHTKILSLEKKGVKNIIVIAPPESGKTTYIKDYIVEGFMNEKPSNHKSRIDRVVYLSNRTLLKNQVKKDMEQTLNRPYSCCYQSIGNTILETDQKKIDEFVSSFAEKNGYKEEKARKIVKGWQDNLQREMQEANYIILDEAHYFTTDSTFNDNTYKEFDYIYNNTSATKIYLTATPDALMLGLENYLSAFKDTQQIYVLDPLKEDLKRTKSLREHNATRYKIEFIHIEEKEEELYRQIDHSTQEDKMIYFTNNKAEGLLYSKIAEGRARRNKQIFKDLKLNLNREIENRLDSINVADKDIRQEIRKAIDKVINSNKLNGGAFLCSMWDHEFNYRVSKEERDKIVNEECFNSDVLVATKTLDNGVNIKDNAVKRIVIDYLSYDEVIQMIGRVRMKLREDFELIHITIIVPSVQELNKRINRNDNVINNEKKKKEPNLFKLVQLEYENKAYKDLIGEDPSKRDVKGYINYLSKSLIVPIGISDLDHKNIINISAEKLYKKDQEIKERKKQKKLE